MQVKIFLSNIRSQCVKFSFKLLVENNVKTEINLLNLQLRFLGTKKFQLITFWKLDLFLRLENSSLIVEHHRQTLEMRIGRAFGKPNAYRNRQFGEARVIALLKSYTEEIQNAEN